ncbi:MAG: ATP-binding protein [Deltaproteobacteria bacterium]|nr:ATP-binding protein [Deltaproteobacteria bacterium]
MVKSFKFKIIIRTLLLTATILLLAYLIFKMDFIFVTITVGLLAVAQVFSIIHFAEKTNRDLSRFLLSIKYDDTSQAFTSDGLGTSFSELKQAFSVVMHKLQETRSLEEVNARYLQTILHHIGTGIIVYRQDGTINLINNAAKKILKISLLKNINDLQHKYPKLADALLHLKQNEKRLLNLRMDNETGYLSIYSHPFVIKEDKNTLISIQNIKEELEEKELEAWQNLIRVLTHEIMNSITPISSMTSTMLGMIDKEDETINPDDIKDLIDALKTINSRSHGLMEFVSNYRNMTLIPTPKFKLLSIQSFFKRIEMLMNNTLTEHNISFRWRVEPESLEFTVDPDLMEQVMINLILNAIHAVEGKINPEINLTAMLGIEGGSIITVQDNGVGIVEEALEKIFIPFFTTKKQGSGIGLSLSRQILRLHHATISVDSKPDVGTTFTLKFT